MVSPPKQTAKINNPNFLWLALLIAVVGTGIELIGDVGYAPVWPSILALTLAILLRRIVVALLSGGIAAALLLGNGHPVSATQIWLQDLVLPVFGSTWNLTVLAFTLLCGGFAALLQSGGGMESIAHRLIRGRKSAQHVEWSAFILGLICFFDGLANSLIVGRTLRPLADRFHLRREKLAYIADSTSAPIACLALATTWVATQLGLIRQGLETAHLDFSAQTILLQSIPANFYCWTALVLVPLTIAFPWGRLAHVHRTSTTTPIDNPIEVEPSAPAAPWRAGVPIAVFVGTLILGLFLDGMRKAPPDAGLYTALSYANAAGVLLGSILIASLLALALTPAPARPKAAPAWLSGVTTMAAPLLVLLAAWILGEGMKSLETASILADILTGELPPWAFPALVFFLASIIAYTTGTSWGTMGLTLPLVIPLAAAFSPESPWIAATVGAALSGAVFGDHTSPFSDTTIISAAAAGCDPWDHVRTQWPYALLAGGVALLAGFLPLGLGLPAPLAALLSLAALTLFVHWRSSPTRHPST